MIGWRFKKAVEQTEGEALFDRLLKLFQEILVHTAGNVPDALSWLTQIDQEHKLTTPEYGIADFIQELKDKGYIDAGDPTSSEHFVPTSKMEIALRKKALDDVFGAIKKSKRGNHSTKFGGRGDESYRRSCVPTFLGIN